MGPFAGVLIEFFCKDYNAQRPTEPNQYYSNFPIKGGAKNFPYFIPFLSNEEFGLQTINTWKRQINLPWETVLFA